MEFKEIVRKRYACKLFNGKKIPEEKLKELLELIRMAPSSYGLQPWRILVIADPETKEKLLDATYNQPQTTSCSHILVFCADLQIEEKIDTYERLLVESGVSAQEAKERTDEMRASARGKDDSGRLNWAKNQLFIAVGNALNGATSLGIDSCPMGGFNATLYAERLELPAHLVPSVLVTIGYAADTPHEKIRFPLKDLLV